MAVITATQVTLYSNITASAATITSSGLIPIVQAKIVEMLNNYFTSDIRIVTTATFQATAATITLTGNNWSDFGFVAGDEIYIYDSYRNDGYQTCLSLSTTVMTLATSSTVYNETFSNSSNSFGRPIVFSMVKWPTSVTRAAALMVAYDYDTRPKTEPGLKSISLGPWSESYTDASRNGQGYPDDILASLPLPVASIR